MIDSVKSEQNDCEKELLKLKYLVPFKEEKESLNQQLNELQINEKELTGKISSQASDINRVQAEYDKKETETIADYQRRSEEKQAEFEKNTEKIAYIASLLERTKGSLYEWLEENKADWEQNIGKVINEEKVLYQTGLHPQKTEGASLYGVKLVLTDLPLNVRKPKQLQEENANLEKELKQAKDEWRQIQQQQEKAIEALKRQFVPKIKELRQQKSLAETGLQMIPQRRKAITVKIEDYEAKAKQIIEERQHVLNTRHQELAHKLSSAQSALEKLNANKQKQLNTAEKKYHEAKAENVKMHEERVANINAETAIAEKNAEAELLRLKEQELDDLKGRGADTTLVEDCKAKIKAAEEELRFIDEHRKLVYDYLRDKEELFDQEGNLKNQKKMIAEKLSQLNEKYQQRKLKHEQQLAAIGKELTERSDERKHLDEEL